MKASIRPLVTKELRQHQGLLLSILAFTALPVTSLDRISLQAAVDEIGRANTGAFT